MKKRNLINLIIVLLIILISAPIGYLYYKDRNGLGTIDIEEIKSVKYFPFIGAVPDKKEYSYDTKNPDDFKAIKDIVLFLNTGKFLGIEKRVPVLNGGTPPHLKLELKNGQYVDISNTGALTNGVLVYQSSTHKTIRLYSPELANLYKDELNRITFPDK